MAVMLGAGGLPPFVEGLAGQGGAADDGVPGCFKGYAEQVDAGAEGQNEGESVAGAGAGHRVVSAGVVERMVRGALC